MPAGGRRRGAAAARTLARMEWPWAERRCIFCLRDDVPMSRSHVIPESVGGFLWARTQCEKCNNDLGSKVDAGAKADHKIRYAIEVALAAELPDIARKFATGQTYLKRTPHGLVRAKLENGTFRIGTTKGDEGSLTQSKADARKSTAKMLRRHGVDDDEIERLLEQFDSAPEGVLTPLTDKLAVQHGAVEAFDLSFDGKPVSDAFPSVIAFHLLALRFGRAIYHEWLHELREAIRSGAARSNLLVVESGRATGYAPFHVVGIAQTTPHAVVRVQLFSEIVWRVHFIRLAASKIKPDGLYFDLKTKTLRPAAPLPLSEHLKPPRTARPEHD